jgi:hypothetical protein
LNAEYESEEEAFQVYNESYKQTSKDRTTERLIANEKLEVTSKAKLKHNGQVKPDS